MELLLIITALPYFFLMLKIFKGLTGIRTFTPVHEPHTNISIVAACRNEEGNITNLLKYLTGQDYPSNQFEIIIVDDNSADNTFKTASGYTYSGNLTVIRNDGSGKKQAVRTGIRHAKAGFIVTTDADCAMGEKWLSSIAAFYESFKPDLIICPVQADQKPGLFRRFRELEFLSLQGVTAGTAINGNSTMCNGANLAFTADSYRIHSDKLHFEITSGDDVFLLHSVKKDKLAGIMWLESPEAIVTSCMPDSFKSFIDQRSRWLSKCSAYNDSYTIALAVSTFLIILSEVLALILGFFNSFYLQIFALVFLIKSLPDFLILRNTTERYGRKKLMRWFFPSQVIYPFYVLSVVLCQLLSGSRSERSERSQNSTA